MRFLELKGILIKTSSVADHRIVLHSFSLQTDRNAMGRIKTPCSVKLRLRIQRPRADGPEIRGIRLSHYHPSPCSKMVSVHGRISQNRDWGATNTQSRRKGRTETSQLQFCWMWTFSLMPIRIVINRVWKKLKKIICRDYKAAKCSSPRAIIHKILRAFVCYNFAGNLST